MKPKFDKDRLLAEMVMDDAGEARETLLGRTLGLARRTRRVRQARRVRMVIAAVALVGMVASKLGSDEHPTLNTQHSTPNTELRAQHPTPNAQRPTPNYVLIETVPLERDNVVETMAPVRIVETFHDPTLRILNDDELLAMAPRASMLRRVGPGQAELIMGQ